MNRVWEPAESAPERDRVGVTSDKRVGHDVALVRRRAPDALVTGATGFIGIHLVKRLLAEGVGVRALVRPNSVRAGRLHGLGVEIIEGDLCDAKGLAQAARGMRMIFHAGSEMGTDWTRQQRVTVESTQHLLEEAAENRVERFIHFSSLAVFDVLGAPGDAAITEECPQRGDPQRSGAYNWAKVQTEKLVGESARSRDLRATIVRPGVVIGPLGRLFFPQLGYRLDARVFILIGRGDNVLPLVYVDNVVDAIWKASQSDSAVGATYNIVDDGEVTVKEYISEFIRITGTDARVVHTPYALPYLLTAAYEAAAGLRLVEKGRTSRAQLRWKQAAVRYDNSKTKRDLGWHSEVEINEGLRRTFEWHRERLS
ncbi:MAG: NAD-dependent epimerase/dehydratase family protein [Gemmatimonadales bacterium]